MNGAIWEAYEESRPDHGQLHVFDGSAYVTHSWDDWRRTAERTAVGLQKLGVTKGSHVACVLTNTFDVCATVIGIWLAGGVVVSLPGMRRGMKPEDYVQQLKRLAIDCDAEMILLEERFAEPLGDTDLGVPLRDYAKLPADGKLEDVAPPVGEELAFVQYSSGSTSDPKGCMLSMRAVSAQEHMLAEVLGSTPEDTGVMWLPLSHDMGLFGCVLMSWVTGLKLAVAPPERFLLNPRTWLDDCADFQATITVSPNFGLALATRVAKRTAPKGKFPMRRVVLGGERVEWETLQNADAQLGEFGFTYAAFSPAYGLAENTLAVSMTETLGEKRYLELQDEARPVVSCGPPVPGVTLRTTEPEEDHVAGRICIRSDALADGYLNDPEKTAQRFVDGELITEDLGVIKDGELYVVGRTDDVIPIAGRNLHARDVEMEVEKADDVRPGCTALVNVGDSAAPKLVMVAETRANAESKYTEIASRMTKAAYRAGGISVDEVVFVRGGSLPKTPSGKVQRFRCQKIAQTDADEVVIERVPS